MGWSNSRTHLSRITDRLSVPCIAAPVALVLGIAWRAAPYMCILSIYLFTLYSTSSLYCNPAPSTQHDSGPDTTQAPAADGPCPGLYGCRTGPRTAQVPPQWPCHGSGTREVRRRAPTIEVPLSRRLLWPRAGGQWGAAGITCSTQLGGGGRGSPVAAAAASERVAERWARAGWGLARARQGWLGLDGNGKEGTAEVEQPDS